MVVSNRGIDNNEIVINIADTSSLVLLVPFELKELPYIKHDQEVVIGRNGIKVIGRILTIDNVVQTIDFKQALFANCSN